MSASAQNSPGARRGDRAMTAELQPLWPLRVTILGNTPLWAVVASLGPRAHPHMERLGTYCFSLVQARATARRMADMLGVASDDIVMMPCDPWKHGPGPAAA